MKTVFKSDEIAHIWANRGAPYGRCASNMSFDGDAFKSYATVIARRIKHKGREAFVLDCASFSATTNGKHQPKVARAIRDSAKVFHVHCGTWGQSLDFTPATLRDYYLDCFNELEAAKPARMAAKRAQAFLYRFSRLEDAIDVCEFFQLPHAKLAAKLEKNRAALDSAKSVVEERARVLRERREAKWEKQRQARERREAAEIASAISLAESIRDGKTPYDGKEKGKFGYGWEGHRLPLLESRPDLQAVITEKAAEFERAKYARWQAGEAVELGYGSDCPTLLRAEGDEMATTKGARVPLADAQRTYRFACLMRAKGWHRNGEQHAIGSYQLDAVNKQGVFAGCHRVTWAEIERFAATQGWKK